MTPEAPRPTRPGEIIEMPTKELLEEFLAGLHGTVTVQFDTEKGKLVRIIPPKLEEGK